MLNFPDKASCKPDFSPNVWALALERGTCLLLQWYFSTFIEPRFPVFCQISFAASTPPTDTRKNKLLRIQTREAAALSSNRSRSSRQSGLFSLLFLLSRRLEQRPCSAQDCLSQAPYLIAKRLLWWFLENTAMGLFRAQSVQLSLQMRCLPGNRAWVMIFFNL